MKKTALALLFVPQLLSALPQKPWLGNLYEFFFDGCYIFSYYDHVANGRPGAHHHSRDNTLFLGLGFTPSPAWDAYVEIEQASTTRQNYNWRSVALQGRYLFLDDIAGDPVSLAAGLSMRGVHHLSLRDISCPYAAEFNLEGNLAAGREWSCGPFWQIRTYGYGALGVAQRGAPWTRLFFSFEGNYQNHQRYQLFVNSIFGFGDKNYVPVDHFHGYANIHHQSVDIGFAYRYHTDIWGTITLEYAYRLYAHAYPARQSAFTFWYHLPFSLF
jgi:hypothetical protein